MREIKFRVRDLKENKWASPNILIDYSGLLVWSFGGEVELIEDRDRYDIQFFTGLKDKNGKEIYEGDVVRENFGEVAVVEWDEDIDTDRYWWWATGFSIHFKGETYGCGIVEVIGNIYENPELLTNSRDKDDGN